MGLYEDHKGLITKKNNTAAINKARQTITERLNLLYCYTSLPVVI